LLHACKQELLAYAWCWASAQERCAEALTPGCQAEFEDGVQDAVRAAEVVI